MLENQDKYNKTIDSFKNYINSIENTQDTMYDEEEYFKDDIEQNDLILGMLHNVVKIIEEQNDKINHLEEEILWAQVKAFNETIRGNEKCNEQLEALNMGWKIEIKHKEETIHKLEEQLNYFKDKLTNGVEEHT